MSLSQVLSKSVARFTILSSSQEAIIVLMDSLMGFGI